jgi:hypothetical protein
MQDGSVSDTGVRFSVRVNGVTYWTLFEKTPAGWTTAALDLSNWRGQDIVLQLMTDSVGANRFDWAWWADLTISQSVAKCAVKLESDRLVFPASGGSGTVHIAAARECPWSITGTPAWVAMNDASSGSGAANVRYSLPVNTGPRQSVVLTVAGQGFMLEEAAGSAGAQRALSRLLRPFWALLGK